MTPVGCEYIYRYVDTDIDTDRLIYTYNVILRATTQKPYKEIYSKTL